MISPALTFRPGAGAQVADAACGMGGDVDFHFHGFDDGERVAGGNRCARLDQQFPDIAGHGAGNAEAAGGNIAVRAFAGAFIGDEAVEPGFLPALPLGVEGGLLRVP